MKPGRATVETLTNHILNFESSRRADKARTYTRKLLSRLWAAVECANPWIQKDVVDAHNELELSALAHRELRRAARRLANLALKQKEALDFAHAEYKAVVEENDRMRANAPRLEGVENPSKLSEAAGAFAEQIYALMGDEHLGVSIVLSNNEGRIGVASNVEPDALVSSVTKWGELVKRETNGDLS